MSRYTDGFDRLSANQKAAKGVSLYSRYVNRPAGRFFAAAGFAARMTPNQMTLLSGLVTMVGVVLLAWRPPTILLGIAVWLILALGFALDSSDGQLARLNGTSSAAGEWLDHFFDCAKMLSVHAAVLITVYNHFSFATRWLLVPLVFQFAAVMMFFGGTLTGLLLKTTGPQVRKDASLIRSLALLPADYGVFCIIFALLGSTHAFFVAYCLLAGIHLLFLLGFTVKWFRELQTIQ